MDKEFKNMDDLLRDTLGGFEKKPSEGVWKKISAGLTRGGIFGFLSSKILWSILGILMVVSLIFFFNYDFKTTNNIISTKGRSEFTKNKDQITKKVVDSIEDITLNYPKVNTGTKQENKISGEHFEIMEGNKALAVTKLSTPSSPNETSLAEKPIAKDLKENAKSNNLEKETYLLTGYYPFLMKQTFDEQLIWVYPGKPVPDQINYRAGNLNYNSSGMKPTTKDDYGKKHNLLYGIHVIPELIFAETDQVNKGIGFELTGRYLLNEFYIETGLGLNFSEDDGGYQIEYAQYDSIGYYYKVNSFTISEITGQPVFNTNLETVFDTIDYATSEVTRNSYTYLYLPFYAGAELYEFKRFSLNLQAGIIYSLMISHHEPGASFTNDNATTIRITNENPSRISSNWLLSASLGFQYQINSKIGLNIEPMFKYYFKPVYEERYNPKQTFGAGLRVGMYFKF
jgi:hypothetical protein